VIGKNELVISLDQIDSSHIMYSHQYIASFPNCTLPQEYDMVTRINHEGLRQEYSTLLNGIDDNDLIINIDKFGERSDAHDKIRNLMMTIGHVGEVMQYLMDENYKFVSQNRKEVIDVNEATHFIRRIFSCGKSGRKDRSTVTLPPRPP